MENCDWEPFIKAAVERNPVAIQKTEGLSIDEVYAWLEKMPDSSIYDGTRLAQPDEVANYGTGDGFEKAFLLADVIRNNEPDRDIEIIAAGGSVTLKAGKEYRFQSLKNIEKQVFISM